MRLARTVVSTLTLLGCSPGNPYRPPTYPEVPDSPVVPVITPSSIWGMVVEESGGCIVGATVTVVRGPGLGQGVTQSTPCSVWDYAGGFVLKDLSTDTLTLRIAASGYVDQDTTFVPVLGAGQALIFGPGPRR